MIAGGADHPFSIVIANFWGMLPGVRALLSSAAQGIWQILNSNFSAAMFGAGFGALAAAGISRRTEKRKRLRDEITGVNNAIALSASVVNTFLAMKKQNVAAMANIYKRTFDDYVAQLRNPPMVPRQYSYITDFRSLEPPLTCIEELRRTLLDHVRSSVPAVSISVPLHQSIASLSHYIREREQSFARLRSMPEAERIAAYFGLLKPDGSLDSSYPDCLSAIIGFVDDGIYFPMLLCEVLSKHGSSLAREYGRNPPTIKTIDYSTLEHSGLLPDRAEYPDFEKQFRVTKATKKTTMDLLLDKVRWLGSLIGQ